MRIKSIKIQILTKINFYDMAVGQNNLALYKVTADSHPGMSKDQKFCEELKNTYCQVDNSAKIESNQKPL